MTTSVKSGSKWRVVLTRSAAGNSKLERELAARGYKPITVESIELAPPSDWHEVDLALQELANFDWVIFTSAVGARNFAERLNVLGLRLPEGRPLVAAVGPATRQALEDHSIPVSFVPSRYLTEQLGSELPRVESGKGSLLVLRSDIADKRMLQVLEQRGFEVEEHAIYITRIQRSARGLDPELGEADAILFASPSGVEGFVSQVGEARMKSLRKKLAACIGPVTAKAAREHGFSRVITPEVHTFEALLAELQKELPVVMENA